MNSNCRPNLLSKGKLKHDSVRNVDFLLLPERVVKLNQTGAAILNLCDGSRTIMEIEQVLSGQFQADNIGSDIVSFVDRLVQHGWVELDCS
jgi:pyrroloquinoline quinone biosynthesis protein D